MNKIEEGKKLFKTLSNLQNLRDNEGKYCEDLVRYEQLCQDYDNDLRNPFLKIRLAKYFWAKYYEFKGNQIKAERIYREALAIHTSMERDGVISDAKIKLQLLKIYCAQSNLDLAFPLLDELLALCPKGHIYGLGKEEVYNIYTIRIYLCELDKQDIDAIKKILRNIYNDIEKNRVNVGEEANELAFFVFTSILILSKYKDLSKADCEYYRRIIVWIDAKNELFCLDVNMKILMYQALLHITTGSLQARYVSELLVSVESNEVPRETKVEILRTVMLFCYKVGQKGAADACLYKCLDILTEIRHVYVRNIDDKKVHQLMDTVQVQFSDCYSIMRQYLDKSFIYEKLLQFKEMTSLVIRERNRIYHGNGFNEKLRLQGIHDEMAGREADALWHGTPVKGVDDKTYSLKLIAEEEFYEQFPQRAVFIPITWEKVQKAIPDNSVVIEYFFYEKAPKEFAGRGYRAEKLIDIYIIRKTQQSCGLKRATVSNGKLVLEEARKFVSILQKESSHRIDPEEREVRKKIRIDLYYRLISPFLNDLNGINRLYIAPDRDLINLPFGMLGDKDDRWLEEEYEIVQMECARDFLFHHKYMEPSGKSLIIGDPQYIVSEKKYRVTDRTSAGGGDNFLNQLPYSGVEARLVSEYCGSPYYSGDSARKSLLTEAKGYRNIHIATHGCFDLYNRTEVLYSSCLAFAGVNNWLETGVQSKIYGNGIVTADEISRLDLRSVELTVISSCGSGMNRVLEDKGFHGLLGGFAAAGVSYVIASLWAVDDFATMLLMELFYSQYAGKHVEPGLALKEAKKELRSITIGQLKQKKWIDYMEKRGVRSKVLQKYTTGEAKECPYKDEIYWGGFVFYQCN